MGKVKEQLPELNPKSMDELTEAMYLKLEYARLYKEILLTLLANPAMASEETTDIDYVESAIGLTKASLDHLNNLKL